MQLVKIPAVSKRRQRVRCLLWNSFTFRLKRSDVLLICKTALPASVCLIWLFWQNGTEPAGVPQGIRPHP